MKERRSQFLINKPLQLRFVAYITSTLLAVCAVVIVSFYFGIWGGVLDAFSDAQIREDLLTASRITQYEDARINEHHNVPAELSLFKQTERLSQRQQVVFKNILNNANKKMLPKFLGLLILIAWGSVYLSHKIAGPLYRFQAGLNDLEKGNLAGRMHLREGDEAQVLGTQFNDAAQSLDIVFSRIKKIVSENETDPEQLKVRLREELSKITTSADK